MGIKSTLVLDRATDYTAPNGMACARLPGNPLRITAKCTALGAVAVTISVYSWVQCGAAGWAKQLLCTLTLSQSKTVDFQTLLDPADTLSADLVFFANPSSDIVTVVVEG